VDLLIDPRYAQLGVYTRTPGIYKCPEDNSSVLTAGSKRARVRSISMNVRTGRCIDCFGDHPTHVGPLTVSTIPNSSMQFVFIDEHPDSINTTAFWLSSGEGRFTTIDSFPSSLHNGGATLGFADYHTQFQRWTDPRTKPAVTQQVLSQTDSPNIIRISPGFKSAPIRRAYGFIRFQ
jgi:hypothetical protein